MKKIPLKSALTALLLVFSHVLYSQNVAINLSGTASPNVTAILDLSDVSNNKLGMLLPNVSLTANNNIAPFTTTPATGLIVWNTNSAMTGGLGVGFYYYSNSVWNYLYNNGTSPTLSDLTAGPGITAFTYNGSSAQTVGIANTGVTAASYGNNTGSSYPYLTINAQGQITAATTVAITGLSTLNGGATGAVLSNSAANTLAWSAAPTISGYLLLSNNAGAPTWLTTPANGILYSNAGVAAWSVLGSLPAGAGILPIANGGTNIGTIGAAGSVIYSNGTQYASTGVGTAGQVLISAGAGTPTWGNTVTSATAWQLLGNSGTTYGTNFIGTTTDAGLMFKVNSQVAGRVEDGTSGGYNTGLGYEALNAVTGTRNVAVGYFALLDNTGGIQNTAVGFQALEDNNGSYNTVMGINASQLATSGSYNTVMGWEAYGDYTTGGSYNTALGSGALAGPSVAGAYSNNTAVGYEALVYNEANNNTALGYEAAFGVSTGSTGANNTAIGYQALSSLTSGTNNTALGYLANIGSGALTNATAIGANASVTASNALVLGSGANVGIGTTAPSQLLQVNGTEQLGTASATQGNLIFANTSANPVTINSSNSTTGAYTMTLPVAQGGAGTVLSDNGAGVLSWITPAAGTLTGANNGLSLSGTTVQLGGNLTAATTITNNTFALNIAGSSATTTFASNGNVGIGNATPVATLDIQNGSNGGYLHVSGTTNPTGAAQGGYLSWNETGGTGETDLINNEGGGSGGFWFFNTPSGGWASSHTTLMVITGGGQVGIGNTAPAATAILDLSNSLNKALLLPQNANPAANITAPANGEIVYNTTTGCYQVSVSNTWANAFGGKISLDQTAGFTGTSSPNTFNITTTNANELIIINATGYNSGASFTGSCKVDNVPATMLANTPGNGAAPVTAVFAFIAPNAGTHSISVTETGYNTGSGWFSNAAASYIHSCSNFSLANITVVCGTTATASSLSLTINTPEPNCYLLVAGSVNTGATANLGVNGAITSYSIAEGSNGCCVPAGIGGTSETASGAYTVNITNSSNNFVSGALLSIKP